MSKKSDYKRARKAELEAKYGPKVRNKSNNPADRQHFARYNSDQAENLMKDRIGVNEVLLCLSLLDPWARELAEAFGGKIPEHNITGAIPTAWIKAPVAMVALAYEHTGNAPETLQILRSIPIGFRLCLFVSFGGTTSMMIRTSGSQPNVQA